MEREPLIVRQRVSRIVRACALVGAAAFVMPALAQAKSGIYSCVDANGRRLTSDRPIAQCTDREQRVLNRDGSLQRVVPPTLTADERAARELEERQRAAERASQREAERADRNLMQRYPDAEAHRKAREAALERAGQSLEASRRRLAELATERKPLESEAEFYVGKALPAKLRHQLDANDAAVQAQRALIDNAEAERVRINSFYDTELVRLRKLWAGAAPGSLGPMPAAADADADKTALTGTGRK
jgi:hypothetical protein